MARRSGGELPRAEREAAGTPRLAGGDAGAAAVEFALVAPLLLTLVVAVMQFGLFFLEQARAVGGVARAAEAAALGELSVAALERRARGGSGAAWVESVSVCYRDPDVAGEGAGRYSRRDHLEVTLTWRATSLELPLVPFLGDGTREERVETRAHQLSASAPPVCAT